MACSRSASSIAGTARCTLAEHFGVSPHPGDLHAELSQHSHQAKQRRNKQQPQRVLHFSRTQVLEAQNDILLDGCVLPLGRLQVY